MLLLPPDLCYVPDAPGWVSGSQALVELGEISQVRRKTGSSVVTVEIRGLHRVFTECITFIKDLLIIALKPSFGLS